jgi:hypothetical protein
VVYQWKQFGLEKGKEVTPIARVYSSKILVMDFKHKFVMYPTFIFLSIPLRPRWSFLSRQLLPSNYANTHIFIILLWFWTCEGLKIGVDNPHFYKDVIQTIYIYHMRCQFLQTTNGLDWIVLGDFGILCFGN